MDTKSLEVALVAIHSNLPPETSKAARDSIERILNVIKNSKAESLVGLAQDFAKPVKKSKPKPARRCGSEMAQRNRRSAFQFCFF